MDGGVLSMSVEERERGFEVAPFSWSGEGLGYDGSAIAASLAASYAIGER